MGKSRSITSTNGEKSCSRGHWRPAEDEKLLKLVDQYGPQNWNFIAESFEGRSGKSCRLRWYNQLNPNINKRPFTEGEEEMLLTLHEVNGNKWSTLARFFPGRTDNAVKNHYHVIMARRKREQPALSGKRTYRITHSKANLGFLDKRCYGISSSNTSPPWSYGGSTITSDHAVYIGFPNGTVSGSAKLCSYRRFTAASGVSTPGNKIATFPSGSSNSFENFRCRTDLNCSMGRTNAVRARYVGGNSAIYRFGQLEKAADDQDEFHGEEAANCKSAQFIDFLGVGE